MVRLCHDNSTEKITEIVSLINNCQLSRIDHMDTLIGL